MGSADDLRRKQIWRAITEVCTSFNFFNLCPLICGGSLKYKHNTQGPFLYAFEDRVLQRILFLWDFYKHANMSDSV